MNKSKLTLLLILTILSLVLITVSCKSDNSFTLPIDESTDIVESGYQEETTVDALNQPDDTIVLNKKYSYYTTSLFETPDDYIAIFSDYTTRYTWSQLCSYYGISLDINNIESTLADYFDEELTYLEPINYIEIPDTFSVYKKDDIIVDRNRLIFRYVSHPVTITFEKDGTHTSPYGFSSKKNDTTPDYISSSVNGTTCYFYEYVDPNNTSSGGYQCTYCINDTAISVETFGNNTLPFDEFTDIVKIILNNSSENYSDYQNITYETNNGDSISINQFYKESTYDKTLSSNDIQHITKYSLDDFENIYNLPYNPELLCEALSKCFSETFRYKSNDTIKIFNRITYGRFGEQEIINDCYTILFISDSYKIPITFSKNTNNWCNPHTILDPYNMKDLEKSFINGTECYILERLTAFDEDSVGFCSEYMINGTLISVDGRFIQPDINLTLDEIIEITRVLIETFK